MRRRTVRRTSLIADEQVIALISDAVSTVPRSLEPVVEAVGVVPTPSATPVTVGLVTVVVVHCEGRISEATANKPFSSEG